MGGQCSCSRAKSSDEDDKDSKTKKFTDIANESSQQHQTQQQQQPQQSIPQQQQQLGPVSIYSLQHLPDETRLLLNSNSDYIEYLLNKYKRANAADSSTSPKSHHHQRSFNHVRRARELQLYISSSYNSSDDTIHQQHCSILNSRHCFHQQQQYSIFTKLKLYCAHSHDCDLHVIDLNGAYSDSTDSLLSNKYYRRLLGKTVLLDLLQDKASCYYTTFVIFLSNVLFASDDDLLCPDAIDATHLDLSKWNRDELALFNKWYKQQQKNEYRLVIDFFSESLRHMNDDLDKLCKILKINAITCLKSIQQEEIEMAIKFVDPSAIVWVHVTSEAITMSDFGMQRYKMLLDTLQPHILADNYKHFVVSNNINKHEFEDAMRNFVHDACKSICDGYLNELNEVYSETIAFKIDSQLAVEISKHHDIFRYYKDINSNNSRVTQQMDKCINNYLNSSKSTAAPLVFYFHEDDECPVDVAEHVSKWLDAQQQSGELVKRRRSVVLRFCASTILASQLSTLLQSVAHQLCYLMEIHESWSFDSPATNLVDNLCKALKFYGKQQQHQPSGQAQQLVLILNRVDKVLHTNGHEKQLIAILKRIFQHHHLHNFKLIMTCSSSTFVKSLRSQFSNDDCCHFLSTNEGSSGGTGSRRSSLEKNAANTWLRDERPVFKSRLMCTQTHIGDLQLNANSAINKLIDVLIELLTQCRYGLKQAEIVDLLTLFVQQSSAHVSAHSNMPMTSSNFSSFTSLTLLNFTVSIAWYSLKYYFKLTKQRFLPQQQQQTLLDTCVDKHQVLYRLSKRITRTMTTSSDETLRTKLNTLVCNYYNNSSNNLSSSSFATVRMYQELPQYHQQQSTFADKYVSNASWLVNKSLVCGTVLYTSHDIVKCMELNDITDADINSSSSSSSNSDDDQLRLFVRLFYKILYSLHHDVSQLYLKLYIEYTNVKKRKTSSPVMQSGTFIGRLLERLLIEYQERAKSMDVGPLPQLLPLNTSESGDADDAPLLEQIAFNETETYLNQGFFAAPNVIVTLSETRCEIKTWLIKDTPTSYSSLKPIRFMKLNKPPRDMRLLNKHHAVVLVDRNLHVFDLNKCEHLLNLNSTLNTNFPFFEVQDKNHIVVLARNRLSVSLMKVSLPEHQTSPQPAQDHDTSMTSSSTSNDHFLFKVGEDRYLDSLMVSRNGEVMVCGDEVQKPFPLLMWNLKDRKLVRDVRQHNHEFKTTIKSIGASGRFVACACQEFGEPKNCIIVYDTVNGQICKKINAKESFVCVELSEQVNVIITCLENAEIIVYDLTSGSKKFTIKSNKYPVNKIKILDTHEKYKNNFLTYSTKGFDWTLCLWDITKGDKLITSYTCPSRIISCTVNLEPLYFGRPETTTSNSNALYVAVTLYGYKRVLVFKLASSLLALASTVTFTGPRTSITTETPNEFTTDETLIHKEITL